MNITKTILFILVGLLIMPHAVRGQVGVGVDMTPHYSGRREKNKKKKKLKDSFVFYFCETLSQDYVTIRTLQKKGYGRMELIKLILIVKYAEVELKKITALRDKMKPLKQIAEKYELDYTMIREESKKYKALIEEDIRTKPVTEEESKLIKEKKDERKNNK